MTPLRPDFTTRYGRWALVTGAAQGIGFAYCQRLAELGMPVVMLDVQADLLMEKAERLRAAGAEVRPVVCDLSDVAAVNAALDSLSELEIGLLVANAGIGAVGRWLDVPQETKVAQVAVNCTSVVVLADRLTPLMASRGRGGVVIMASGSAEMGSSFIATYAATKAFDRVLAEGLWLALAPHGVDVTAVMPGAVDTEGFHESLPHGVGPTRMMSPVPPSTIVEAALAGLGTKVNVRPQGKLGPVVGAVMKLVPRTTMMRLGEKAVKAQYDHGRLLPERERSSP
jgi:short-subunit dehydrogenase